FFIGAALLVVVPWVVRNEVVYREPIVISVKNGGAFLFGNNPDADGGVGNEPNHPPWCPGLELYKQGDYIANDRAFFACGVRQARGLLGEFGPPHRARPAADRVAARHPRRHIRRPTLPYSDLAVGVDPPGGGARWRRRSGAPLAHPGDVASSSGEGTDRLRRH